MDSRIITDLLQPLLRLVAGMACALLLANILEALNWTRVLARPAAPLVRFARLGSTSGAAFALAFLSPASSNALLAAAHDKGALSARELMLANLFNSFPTFLLHLPTLFLLTWPVLGPPAAIYAGLCLAAAAARTLLTAVFAHFFLPPPAEKTPDAAQERQRESVNFRSAGRTAFSRFRRRLPRLVSVTIPVYVLMYVLQRQGYFAAVQDWLAVHADWLSFLKPQALGIIALHLAAEMGAALSAAGSVFNSGGLTSSEVVLALLVGNILSTPMRAIRHQLPSYAGFFRPARALELVLLNQGMRALSMIVTAWLYLKLG